MDGFSLLGSLQRAKLNHWTGVAINLFLLNGRPTLSAESSFRNSWFFKISENAQSPETQSFHNSVQLNFQFISYLLM
jgi:hypothetical protein